MCWLHRRLSPGPGRGLRGLQGGQLVRGRGSPVCASMPCWPLCAPKGKDGRHTCRLVALSLTSHRMRTSFACLPHSVPFMLHVPSKRAAQCATTMQPGATSPSTATASLLRGAPSLAPWSTGEAWPRVYGSPSYWLSTAAASGSRLVAARRTGWAHRHPSQHVPPCDRKCHCS